MLLTVPIPTCTAVPSAKQDPQNDRCVSPVVLLIMNMAVQGMASVHEG